MTVLMRFRKRAFTLVELVVVVLILGILAAVAAPKMINISGDAEVSALRSNLKAMRDALDYYALEHGGNYPGSLVAIARYTNEAGAISSNRSAVYKLGKYIKSIPPCPTGPRKGATGWGACTNPPAGAVGSTSVGWLYHAASGSVWVNDANHLDK